MFDHASVFKPHIPATCFQVISKPSVSQMDEMLLPSDLVFKPQLRHQLPQEDTLCPSEDLVPLMGAPAASKHTCLNSHHKQVQYPFTGRSPPLQDPG